MADNNIAAFGSNLVQIVGAIMLIIGLFGLPDPMGWFFTIGGGVIVAVATVRYQRFSKGG